MLVVVIRDGNAFSLKTRFINQIFDQNLNVKFVNVFRKESNKFTEKWYGNSIELATSIIGIFIYFTLMQVIKNPIDIRNGLIRRFAKQKKLQSTHKGSLNIFSQVLYQYFGRKARTSNLMRFLTKINEPLVFIIDEFFSLTCVDINALKALGCVIYVSSDTASDFYGTHSLASKLMYNFEKAKIALPDVVVACSRRDRLKYLEMGVKNVWYYPNIYPTEFELNEKNQTPSIAIIMRGHWGTRGELSLEEVFESLSHVNRKLKVFMIGERPKKIPKNVELFHYDFIPSRSDYLKILSKSWIGINIGVHAGGTNERKYDYAMAELVVFSDCLGARGELLIHEYTYLDKQDLVVKLEQIINLGKNEIVKMGNANRQCALSQALEQRAVLIDLIKSKSLCNQKN